MANVDSYVKIKGRSYGFYAPSASGGGFLRINDTTAPYMAMLARTFPMEFAKALKSLGYMLFKRVRQAMDDGGVGGTRWQELSGLGKVNQKVGARARRTRIARSGFYGQLYKAVGYRADAEGLRVQIGFLSYQSQDKATKLQEGFDTPVTNRMRRQFNAADRHLSGKSTIHTPGRPLIEPVFHEALPEILPFVEAKVLAFLKRNSAFRKAA